ncbi:hypothetical protein HPPN135_01080 [Helicobacter pylori Puno135]|nr:hypothetical protein HPPN135_01080 [Helicobacter pylori Puno135]
MNRHPFKSGFGALVKILYKQEARKEKTYYSKLWLLCQALPHSYKGYNKWMLAVLKLELVW